MKITILNGSPRANGNTEIMAKEFEKGAKEAGNAEELKKSQDQALTLKQDIARRQWEKKIPLSKLECYLKGTIKKNAFTK